MNSYPPELLTQLAPVMFVAGLDTSAGPSATAVSPSAIGVPGKVPDEFHILILRLREALLAQHKLAIWQPERLKSFHVVLVDKDVRFPPRKPVPPDDPQYSSSHSPLSPLTYSSPLYPDGLIAPIWIRKHTTLLPSVFVLFLRIYEPPLDAALSPSDVQGTDRKREREQEQVKHDADLAGEVAARKKSASERGVKLTVVLLASRRLLDDPSLDARLTYIRKHGGLDSRAALFVLSPVSPTELGEFLQSLREALFDSALEYYASHSKTVRRKRNRHAQAHSSYANPPAANLGSTRPLRPEGWTVRYEYKMASFAEFRGEDELALKHYQDAYDVLVMMFSSVVVLPPRTKRWAEAKVLIDCINIKIVKLYLYHNEHVLALSHHNMHMRKFGDFSRGWGIGEETFEFWSWMARQNRVLGELVEQGMRTSLQIPLHIPSLKSFNVPTSQTISGTAHVMVDERINPAHALQHPGFYYYMAARCVEHRRERFQAAVNAELNQQPITISPGFASEKKVDHTGIILELYTKAYELFKKQSASASQTTSQGRLTLWIAYRIAQTYYDSGKVDMAARFFERIAKSYRQEKWNEILRPLLSTWYACAQQLDDVNLSIRLMIEMLAFDALDYDERTVLEEDIIAVLESTVPASIDSPLVVELPESQPIFDSNVVFWTSEVKVEEFAAFQLSLTAPTGISIASLPFTSLTIHFDDSHTPVIVRHSALANVPNTLVQCVDLGLIVLKEDHVSHDAEANLRWQPGSTLVLTGRLVSGVPTSLKITKLTLNISVRTWNIEIPFKPCVSRLGKTLPAKWLSQIDPPRFIPVIRQDYSSAIVKHRPHNLHISLEHPSPAFLDERYPITIEIHNLDARELDVYLDVLLQPSNFDGAVNGISMDDETSSSLIKGIHLGTLISGVTIVKTLHLLSTGEAGDRMLDISVRSKAGCSSPVLDEDSGLDPPEIQDSCETLHTLVIPTVHGLEFSQDVTFRCSLEPWPNLADLDTFKEDFWAGAKGCEAIVNIKLECAGPSSLQIDLISLQREDHANAKIISSSLEFEGPDVFPAEYFPGDDLRSSCLVGIAPLETDVVGKFHCPFPGKYIVQWRRIKDGVLGTPSTSIFTIPSLKPPTDDLVALLNVPLIATLHVPFEMKLTIRNYHPTNTANVNVQIDPDSAEGFVIAGIRSGHVPVLLSGDEETLKWKLIPLECGQVKIPEVKVINRRKMVRDDSESHSEAGDELVRIVDVHFDGRPGLDEEHGVGLQNSSMTTIISVFP